MVLFRITENEPSKMHNVRPYVYSRPCPALHILFLFLYFFFVFLLFFCHVLCCHFLKNFCIFFMFTNFGILDIESRKRKRNLLIGQPQGSLSESINTTMFICFDLKLLFLVACLLED